MLIERHIGVFCALVLSIGSASHVNAAEEYRLSPGDSIEVGIFAVPGPFARATVQLDGAVSLPETGTVAAAGLTLNEFRAQIESVLSNKLFRVRGPDGREQLLTIKPADVSVSIAEYRPIYVTGDVLTPGQQVYRPMMTIRQAIAMAGGYSLLRSRNAGPGADPIELRSSYESNWADYTREYYRVARLEAELRGAPSFDVHPPEGSPLSSNLVSEILKIEAAALQATYDETKQEREFLTKAQKDTHDQIRVLQEREKAEAEAVKADEDELARVTQAYEAGNLTNTRMADVRRALLLSSSRRLETSVELMRARRQQDEYARQLERGANQRKAAILEALNDANVRLAELTARLRAASERLQPNGTQGTRLPMAGEETTTEIVVVRKRGEQWLRLSTVEDAEVMPGDVIEAKFVTRLEGSAIH